MLKIQREVACCWQCLTEHNSAMVASVWSCLRTYQNEFEHFQLQYICWMVMGWYANIRHFSVLRDVSVCNGEMVNKHFLIEFIAILKEQTAIWQSSSDVYKDRTAKQKGWEKLLEKYKEVDRRATTETVKKKYQGLRACYRRELQKIRESEKSGTGSEDLYTPTLWYFHHLEFLSDQNTQLDGIATIDDPIEEKIVKKPSLKRKASDRSIYLQKAVKHLQRSSQRPNKDESDIYSESWAVTFRKLNSKQKIFAKRLIDETLTYAQLDQLSCSSFINPGVKNVRRTFVSTASNCNDSDSYSSTPNYSTFPAYTSPTPISLQGASSPIITYATPSPTSPPKASPPILPHRISSP